MPQVQTVNQRTAAPSPKSGNGLGGPERTLLSLLRELSVRPSALKRMEARKRTQTDSFCLPSSHRSESLPEMKPAVGETKAKRQSKIHEGLMTLFELWVQPHLRPSWWLVLTVSLTQTIVTWEQKGSHWGTTQIRLACGQVYISACVHANVCASNSVCLRAYVWVCVRAWGGERMYPFPRQQITNYIKLEIVNQVISMHAFILSALDWIWLACPATLTSSQW